MKRFFARMSFPRAVILFCTLGSAVLGTLMILMIVRIARRLTRSTLLGAIAGILLICDGVLHLIARSDRASKARG